MPRILAAVVSVIALHAVALIFRPGVSGERLVTPAKTVLAVRLLHRALLDPPAPTIVNLAPTLSVVPAQERESSLAPKPQTRAVAKADPARERNVDIPASSPRVIAAVGVLPDSVLAAAPDYVLGIQLDPGPRPLDEIDPEYPDTVRLRSGTVELRLLISDTGHVDDVSVVRAEPKGVFEQAAIEAFSKARFAPGIAGGRPVKSQIRVEVEFMPINRGARISGRSY